MSTKPINPDIYIGGKPRADKINKEQHTKINKKFSSRPIKPGDIPKQRDRIVNLA